MDEGKAVADTLGKMSVALASDVYKDLAQPSVRHMGTALGTLTQIAVSPVSLLGWGFERTKLWLTQRIEARMRSIPEEDRQEPPLSISYPVLTNIAISHGRENLQQLYLELLLKAMDRRTANLVHPSYVTIISQMEPEEALILLAMLAPEKPIYFVYDEQKRTKRIAVQFADFCASNVHIPDVSRSAIWLESLLRQRLLEKTNGSEVSIRNDEFSWRGPGHMITDNMSFEVIEVTDFGKNFVEAVRPTEYTAQS